MFNLNNLGVVNQRKSWCQLLFMRMHVCRNCEVNAFILAYSNLLFEKELSLAVTINYFIWQTAVKDCQLVSLFEVSLRADQLLQKKFSH